MLFVGSANDMDDVSVRKLAEYVKAPMEPADAFVLFKGRHFNGSTYSDPEIEALRGSVDRHLRPVDSYVGKEDRPYIRFRPSAAQAVPCLYPDWMRLYSGGTSSTGRSTVEAVFAYWWGAWQMGWEMIAAHEAQAGITYETIVLVRADLDFQRPIRARSERDGAVWYTAIEPPDAFWVMPRQVAGAVLTSASRMLSCSGDAECCTRMPGCFQYSWVR